MIRNNSGFYVAQRLSEELFLMRGFINQQEKQISNYVQNIDYYIETDEAEKWHENSYGKYEKVFVEIQHIEGIAEDDYDFKGIFTEVMPLYQRQAMLVALWGRIETKLDDIANHLAKFKGTKIKKKTEGLSDFIHLINEIDRLGVKIRNTDECSSSVDIINDDIREIRNAWVHHGGKATKNKVKKVVASSPYLRIESEVICITKEYVLFSIDEMSKISRKILDEFIAQKIS